MSDDARTHGSFFQNLELLGASAVDLAVDGPTILYNKATGSDAALPLDLGAKVYADQTAGQFTDANGNVLSTQQVEQGASDAEAQGAVIDAGVDSAKQIAADPLSVLKAGVGPTLDLIPTWAKVAAVVLVVGVGVLYVVQAASVAKALRG